MSISKRVVKDIIDRHDNIETKVPWEQFEVELSDSLEYIQSAEARRSMEMDPYWPKWNSPWWHMMLLHEMGLTNQIPKKSINLLLDCLKQYYLDFFPYRQEEMPAGKDMLAHVMCHCQLGCVYQLLHSANVDVEVELPWVRNWFVRYQLIDGGFNCDESAYTKDNPKSSLVSTLPMLEALLVPKNVINNEEVLVLNRGAEYLLKRKLFRSASTNSIMNESWAKLMFPRFYEYDLLRGLSFIIRWSLVGKKPLRIDDISEVLSLLDKKMADGNIIIERSICNGKTRIKNDDGTWDFDRQADLYPLLSTVSTPGTPSPFLVKGWKKVIGEIAELIECDLLQF